MEGCFKVLLIFCVTAGICRCQEFAYFRCNNATKTLQYVYFSETTTPLYDIFAQSKMSTCSLRAGAFSGTGRTGDPYILEIDLRQGLLGQSPDCGVKQATDGTVQLEMVAQKSCTGVASTDQRSLSSCRMTIPDSNPGQTTGRATYSCQPPSTIVFQFLRQGSDLPAPADIYAVNKRATCSKSARTGSGQGLPGDPFLIKIDATDITANCGVQGVGENVYNVTMYVQQFQSVITASDTSYQLTCNFTGSASQILETFVLPATNNAPTHTVTPSVPSTSLSVVSQTGSGAVTSLVVGEQIRLVAQLLDGPATGMRLTSCEARPGPGQQPVLQVLDSQGCSTQPALVPPFIGQSPVGRVAMTNLFSAFKFDQSNTVYFRCQVSFCYDNDVTCLGSHCPVKARRRRDIAVRNNDTLEISIQVLDFASNTDPADHTGTTSQTGNTNTDNRAPESSPALTWPISALVVVSCLSAATVVCSVVTVWVICKRFHTPKETGQ